MIEFLFSNDFSFFFDFHVIFPFADDENSEKKKKTNIKLFRCYHERVIFITHRVFFSIPSKFYRDSFTFFFSGVSPSFAIFHNADDLFLVFSIQSFSVLCFHYRKFFFPTTKMFIFSWLLINFPFTRERFSFASNLSEFKHETELHDRRNSLLCFMRNETGRE